MFYVFDFDGTICDISHRIHHVRNGNRNWDSFFADCVGDVPKWDVINLMRELSTDNVVEIWSGRSDVVRKESEQWLENHSIDPEMLTRMRPAGDYTPDHILKENWLKEEQSDGLGGPHIIFDDRQRVVDMWRANGVTCAQVAPGDFDNPKDRVIVPTENNPATLSVLLTLLIGPSGAGKDTWLAEDLKDNPEDYSKVVSSDQNRGWLTGDFKDQTRNDDMWVGLHSIVKARLHAGMPTIVNATNIRTKDRKALLDLLPMGEFADYVVINRPLKDKLATRGWRPEWLIEKHHQTFTSNARAILAGDNDPRVLAVHEEFIHYKEKC